MALAINVGDARRRGGRRHPHRLAGGARRCRPPALRRRLDRPGAVRGAAWPRGPPAGGAPSATSARRSSRRWSTGCCWSRSASAIADRRDRPPRRPARRSTAAACSPSACSAWPATLAATLVLARGEREDINLEGVLRHSAADALGSLGVVIAGAFVLAGGSAVVDPIVGLADRRPDPALLLAADQGALRRADGGGAGRASTSTRSGAAICAEEGVRSVHDLHVWTVTSGFGALAAHVVVAPDCDRDLDPAPARAAAARALRHRAHHAADGGGGRRTACSGSRTAPPTSLIASAGCSDDFPASRPTSRLASLARDASGLALPWRLSSLAAAALVVLLAASAAAPAAGPRIASSKPRKRSSPRCANARAC